MATPEQEEEIRQELTTAVAKLTTLDPKSLERTGELGTVLGFQGVRGDIERILDLFSQLKTISLDGVPYLTMHALLSQANDALAKFDQIEKFNPKDHENATSVRDSYLDQVRDAYDTYFDAIYPFIAYGRARGEDLKGLQRQAQESVDAIDTLKEEIDRKQSEVTSEIEQVLGHVRDSAGKIGVAKYASHFKDEADDHETKARKWLNGTIWIGIATFGWGIATFFIHPSTGYTSGFDLVQFTVPKIIVLSILFTALVWAGRNYQAHRHNSVINKHRQNSLSTFEGFVSAAGDDPDTKNAVLLQATQSIFSSQATGYSSPMSEADGPQKVIEIFRSVGEAGKAG